MSLLPKPTLNPKPSLKKPDLKQSELKKSELKKPEVYESRQLRLTSPALHIGSETQKLSPFEYVAANEFVCLPDMDALTQALYARGKQYLERYIQCIQEKKPIRNLLEEALGNDWEQSKNNERTIFLPDRRSSRQTQETISDLRPMIRNGWGQVYIPGSSIKGAIRTAIAYYMVKHANRPEMSQNHSSAIENQIRQKIEEIKRKPKFADDKIFMNQLFSEFSLEGDRSKVRRVPNTDFMRAVHVTDSQPLLEESDLCNRRAVHEVMLISHDAGWKAKYKSPLYVELVRQVNTRFEITLDTELLKKFKSNPVKIPFQSIDDILAICREFAEDQWQQERSYWLDKMQANPAARDQNNKPLILSLGLIREFYQAQSCPYGLRIGWASGMPGTTVGMLFSEDLRQELRSALYPGNNAPGFEVPKSRRIVANRDRELEMALGWVKFESI